MQGSNILVNPNRVRVNSENLCELRKAKTKLTLPNKGPIMKKLNLTLRPSLKTKNEDRNKSIDDVSPRRVSD